MTNRRKGRRPWAFGILAFLAIAIGAYALVLYGSPTGIRDQFFVTEKGSLPDLWYIVLWGHAVSAGLALTIGWLQFLKRLRLKKPNIHRMVGYIYSVMNVIGGITGLYLAYYADGGWIAKVGFGTLSILWLYTLIRGLKSIIVDHDQIKHGRWMVRNYALSCAAIALRLYIPLSTVLLGLSDTNDTFAVIAWLCWVPNLFLAEILIRSKARTNNSFQV